MAEPTSQNPTPSDVRRRAVLTKLALLLLATLLAWAVYRPALRGDFISDDHFYIGQNPYVKDLGPGQILDVFDPGGSASVATLNYAPVHLLFLSVEWRLFGASTTGYHLVNVILHVAVCALLFLLLKRLGAADAWALLFSTLFLLHPANVESVAWIFQSKTLLSVAFALGALLLAPRGVAGSTLLFAAGLLTKVSAAVALVSLAAWIWNRPDEFGSPRRRGLLLGAWLVAFALAAIPILSVLARLDVSLAEPGSDAGATRFLAPIALWARYLAMSSGFFGLSTFQQPHLPQSLADPWFLAGLVSLAACITRWIRTLLRRDLESVGWTFALGAYAPVSQIVRFPYPVADRYLYTILPGLLAVAALGFGRIWATRSLPRWTQLATSTVVLFLAMAYSKIATERAGLWLNDATVNNESARNYPDGMPAHMLRARNAAVRGDAEACATALRHAFERGQREMDLILLDPIYQNVRDDASFQAVMQEMARWWLARAATIDEPTEAELIRFSNAEFVLGNVEASIELMEQAIAMNGPQEERLRVELERRRKFAP